jgi:hypothetical protein
MHPNIALRVILRRLLHTLHPLDFGQYLSQQPRLIQQLEPSPRPTLSKNSGQLIAHPFSRHHLNRRRLLPDRIHRSPLDGELQPRRKSHRPQHPQLVLRKPQLRLPNRPHQPSMQVPPTTHIILYAVLQPIARLVRHRIQQQPIDGEVPPQHILARV